MKWRKFSVAFLMILFSLPTYAVWTKLSTFTPAASGFTFPATFEGNPNPSITAIDTSGGIAASRTSCQTPCFVHLSGSAITATGTSKPYEDLEFSWNFGDASGTETFTNWYTNNGTTGVTVNVNNTQTGPEAVYVYRSAGTYTATLGIRGKNAGVCCTTATKTVSITVTTFNASGGNWYFDSAAAGGGDGLSPATAFNDLSQMNNKLAIDKAAIHIAKGSSFTTSTGLVSNIDLTGLRMDSYGSGAIPTITISGGSTADFSLSMQSAHVRTDIVVSGIHFHYASMVGTDHQAQILVNTTSGLSNIYFDNINVTSAEQNRQAIAIAGNYNSFSDPVNGGCWKCDVSWTVTPNGNVSNIGPLPAQFGFIMGGSLGGDGTSTVFDHHIYPQTRSHLKIAYVNFTTAANKNYCINTNTDLLTGDATGLAQYVQLSNNNFTGVVAAWDASNSNGNTTDGFFQNFVSQFNIVHDLSGTPVFFQGAASMTVRWNNFWNNGITQIIPVNASSFATQMSIYQNKIYVPDTNGVGDQAGIFELDGASVSAAAVQIITDNTVQDQATSNMNAMQGDFSKYQTASSIIDRNSWYRPSQASDSIYWNSTTGGGTATSLATMRSTYGFEVNSTQINAANPGWSNPGAGVFQ